MVAARLRAACTLAPVATAGNALGGRRGQTAAFSPRRARKAARSARQGPFPGRLARPVRAAARAGDEAIEPQPPRLGQAPLGLTGRRSRPARRARRRAPCRCVPAARAGWRRAPPPRPGRRRLLDAQAAGHVDVDVVAGEVHAGMAGQHRDQHQHPVHVDPRRGAAGRSGAGRGDQRLDLDGQRPRALQRDRHRAAGHRRLLDSRKKRLASATSTSPSPRISSTPTSSVEPKRFFAARMSRVDPRRSPSR